jgi:DNA-binding transcriptional regulator YiaG
LPSSFPLTYQFSKPLNPLDYDPTYPKNPTNLAQYIRKFRKDKRLLIREFAKELGIHKFTLIKWEGGRLPHPKYLKKLRKAIPGLAEVAQDSYQKNVP